MKKRASFGFMIAIIIIVLILLILLIGYLGYKEAEELRANCDIGFSKFCWRWHKLTLIE